MEPNAPLPNFSGELLAIAIAEKAKAPMRHVETIVAEAGAGLRGDRYAEGLGITQKKRRRIEQQVTLIAAEAIAAAAAQLPLPFGHLDCRRNLLTRGVPLNDLIGETFWVGDVQLRGFELCAPCHYLQRMTQPGVMAALKDRGGIRAVVVSSGALCVGDAIRSETADERAARLQPIVKKARERHNR